MVGVADHSETQQSMSFDGGSNMIQEPVRDDTQLSLQAAHLSQPDSAVHDDGLPKFSVDLLKDERISFILNSDLALDALLKRFKESINNCDEFAKFIKKKAAFQEEYDYQVRKLAKNTQEFLKHNSQSLRQDSFTRNFDLIVNFDDRLHNVGYAYVTALQTMSDELFQLSANMLRQRRVYKDEGKRREKDVIDSIIAADKAKAKYQQLCTELERVRTNEPVKKFTLKSKTASQIETDLLQRIELANSEYASKVDTCKRLKDELLKVHRPSYTNTLKDLILEIDLAMSVQLQKYTTWCENLLMNSGVLISPLREESRASSMKGLAASIDNEKDLFEYLMKYSNAGPSKQLTVTDYQVHPAMTEGYSNSHQHTNNNINFNSSTNLNISNNNFNSTLKTTNTSGSIGSESFGRPVSMVLKGTNEGNSTKMVDRRQSTLPSANYSSLDPSHNKHSMDANFMNSNLDESNIHADGSNLDNSEPQNGLPSSNELQWSIMKPRNSDVPLMFGGPIEQLCLYEKGSVPIIVRKLIKIIDVYGLELEGIYRMSGNSSKVTQLKDALNHDRSLMDRLIANPDQIIESDIFCIASLLKLYFSKLPKPLLTKEMYPRFIEAVKFPDASQRKKRLHEAVYGLPDANYFTLRAIILHLTRVTANQNVNRMTAKNLGIIWGPNLLTSSDDGNTAEFKEQGEVVENLMHIADAIFEPE